METIAAYREERPGTYGIEVMTGLVMIEGRAPRRSCALWDRLGLTGNGSRLQYHLVLASETAEEIRVRFVVDRPLADIYRAHFLEAGFVHGPSVEVDLIQFQGPHFCDRDGIADTALSALADNGPVVLACAFLGSRAHLVFPRGTGNEAAHLLEQAFSVPARTTVET